MSSKFDIQFLNSKATKILLGSLLFCMPILVSLQAKADMHTDMSQSDELEAPTETDAINDENPYGDTDGGADGEPVAVVMPTEGTIDVMLENNTNAAIDYQAIGFTENQTLEGGEKHTMVNLPVPVVIRTARQDDGFVKILPLTDTEGSETLKVTLDEDEDFYDDDNLGVIRIEADGGVFVN